MSGPLSAELVKQSGQRALLFWGFAAVPLLATFTAFALESAIPTVGGSPLAASVHPIRSAMRSLGLAGNPVAQLFWAIGASALFTVEYRHATWRHIVPRRGRAALILAKALVFALLAAASLVLLLAGDLLASLVLPLARGLQAVDTPPATPAGLALSFLLSFAELTALSGSVALMAVLTRSTLGAVLPPFLLGFAAAGAMALFTPTGDALARIPVPTFAADGIRSWIWAGADGASGASALIAAAWLLGWILLTYGAAILLFSRQDLSAE